MSSRPAGLCALVGLLTVALLASGCAGDGDERPRLTVSAASSLKTAFERYARSFDAARVRFSFAGSDELAAQVERGARPDVYAAANTSLPQRLFEAGRVERPTMFARNRLVIAVPSGSDRVRAIADLTREEVRLVIGDPDVPVGSYARTLLERLPAGQRRAILANVRSREPDVLGIVAKLRAGAADAGLVYATDVEATRGELEAIALPRGLAPDVEYGIAVVAGSEATAEARAFVEGLRSGAGREALRAAGFLPPVAR